MRVKTTNTKRADEKLTPDQVRALTKALVSEAVIPSEVGAKWAIIGSIVAIVLSAVAVVIAVAK